MRDTQRLLTIYMLYSEEIEYQI